MATTARQRAAVEFCCYTLGVSFTGDINNQQEVSDFLGHYLESAKQQRYLDYETAMECSDILDKDYYE